MSRTKAIHDKSPFVCLILAIRKIKRDKAALHILMYEKRRMVSCAITVSQFAPNIKVKKEKMKFMTVVIRIESKRSQNNFT